MLKRWRERLIAAMIQAKHRRATVAESIGLDVSDFNKRCRGDVKFTTYEFLRLSERYGLMASTSSVPDPSRITFAIPDSDRPFSPEAYMDGLSALGQFLEERQPSERPRITVSSTELPVFHLFNSPELTAFKFFIFRYDNGHSIQTPFELSAELLKNNKHFAKAQQLYRLYADTDLEEVWGGLPLKALSNQIYRVVDANAISSIDGARLIKAMHTLVGKLVEGVAGQVLLGGRGSFSLHQDPLFGDGPNITIANGSFRFTASTYDAPHYMTSMDSLAHEGFTSAFRKRRRRSLKVGSEGAIAVQQFRAALQGEIINLQRRIAMCFERQALESDQ